MERVLGLSISMLQDWRLSRSRSVSRENEVQRGLAALLAARTTPGNPSDVTG